MAWLLPSLKLAHFDVFAISGKIVGARSIVRNPIARIIAAAAIVVASASTGSAASGCRSESYETAAYTVCSYDPRIDELRIFWRDDDKNPFRTFSAVADEIAGQSRDLAFAMNGGMYQEDLSPVGLLVIAGNELKGANTIDISGEVVPNFYKKPNGVFYVDGDSVGILETGQFLAKLPEAEFATQSGPMLVVDGKIHPAFIEGSPYRKQRNGVGVSSPTEVHFVISQGGVSFHQFASFFRDRLGCDNALFLDGGSAPGIYAPDLGRNDPPAHGGYGPIIGVVGEVQQ